MFNILVIDDDNSVRGHVRDICLGAGEDIAVFEAGDSQEALDVLEHNLVALCIMDLHLPDVLGTELLRMVKKQYRGTKVIMLSGDNSFDNVRTAFVYEADDYIEKPVEEEKLLAKVRELREKHFVGLKTIEVPKKSLSEYVSIAFNEEFSALGKDDEDRFYVMKSKYGFAFDEGEGVVMAFELEGFGKDQSSEYYYSFLAETLRQELSAAALTYFFFYGRLFAVANYARPSVSSVRDKLAAVKNVFNENGLMMSAFITDPFGEEISFFGVYESLLDTLKNREMYGKNEITVGFAVNSGRRPSLLIQKAKRYIQDVIYESFSLVDVAEYLGIHPNYLSKIFKQAEGISFTDYVCDCKMKEAKRLLTESNDKIRVIAEKLHYYDPGYFIRIFKKYYGISPNQFRQHRG